LEEQGYAQAYIAHAVLGADHGAELVLRVLAVACIFYFRCPSRGTTAARRRNIEIGVFGSHADLVSQDDFEAYAVNEA